MERKNSIEALKIGKMYIAYEYNENGKDIHQAFRFIPISKNSHKNKVHVMEDTNPLGDTLMNGVVKISFDELSKRDGDVINLKYDTWEHDGEFLTNGEGRHIRYQTLKIATHVKSSYAKQH